MKKNIKLLLAMAILSLSSMLIIYKKIDYFKLQNLKSCFSCNNQDNKKIYNKNASLSTIKKRRRPNCAANYIKQENKQEAQLKINKEENKKNKERSIYRKQYGQRFKKRSDQKTIRQNNK